MAFQTGTQVNAALGRTDYTPFLQGAMQGAQAQARGAENIAAGLAGLGQQVATGIEKYYKKEEEKKVRQQGIDFLVNNFGVTEKAAGAGIGAVGAQAFASFLQSEKERQRVEQSSQYAGLLEQSGGAPVSLESGPMSSVAQQQGRAMYLDNLYKQSQIAQNFAASNKQPVGQIMSLDEIENYKRGGFDIKAIPVGGGQFRVESISPFGQAPVTNIRTGDDQLTTPIFNTMVKDRDLANSAMNALPSYKTAVSLLKEGKVMTGSGAEVQLALSKGLGALGISLGEDKIANTEVLIASLAQPVFSLVKQLGSGSGISDKDLEFAQKAAGGKITLDNKSILRLIEIGQRASQNTINSYTQRLDEAFPESNKDLSQARSVLKLIQPRSLQEQADAIVGGK